MRIRTGFFKVILAMAAGLLFASMAMSLLAQDADRTFLHPAEDNQTKNLTLTPGTYTFRADAEPNGYFVVDWYNTYSGGSPVETAYFYYYDDKDFSLTSSGWVRAEIYRSDFFNNRYEWLAAYRWNVTVNRAPTTPGTISISSVTRTGATMSWGASTDADGDTITYEVQYGINNTPGWTSGGTTTSRSKSLSGLNPNTTYVVQVRATDGRGGVSSWNQLDPAFTTLANHAPTTPGTISISGVTSNSASVSWGASSDLDGDSITYEIEYGVNNTPGWTSGGTTTGTSKSLTGLTPNTTYVVRVRARDNFSTIAYSSWNEKDPAFTTLPVNRAPTIPGTISISGITRTGATMSWGASTDADGDTITYEVQYGINNTPGWTSGGTTTSTSKTLSGLAQNTTYVVQVRATDGRGGVSSWNQLDPAFTTLANHAPTTPGTISISSVTSNSASVSWGASSDSDGDSITYEIEYGVNNTIGWDSGGTTTGTSKTLTGLTPDTTYVVRVRARDNFSTIAYSSWNELDPAFTTRPPNRAPTITVSAPPSGGAAVMPPNDYIIQWSASDLDGDTLTITLYYDSDNSPGGETLIASGLGNSGSYTWDVPAGLVGQQVYVRAIVSDGSVANSDYSDGRLSVQSPPEISVSITLNGTAITDNSATPIFFGSVVTNQTGPKMKFTVRNDGGTTLNLGSVTVPPGFTVTDPLVSSLASGATDTLEVRLDSVTIGAKSGQISFSTDDSDESPFNFSIFGTVIAPRYGITIITHGYGSKATTNSWAGDMGVAILNRAGKGRLWYFDVWNDRLTDVTTSRSFNGSFVPDPAGQRIGEQVILVDWQNTADNTFEATAGHAEAVGHALYALLMGGASGQTNFVGSPSARKPLHFIAHSFGCTVISEAIQRLGLQGIEVEQMTTLDPHDWDEQFVPVDGGALQPDVHVWSNVVRADNYYETCCGGAADNPHGRPIVGAQNFDLTSFDGFSNGIINHPHTRAHIYYHGTIEPASIGTHIQDDGTIIGGFLVDPSWYPDLPSRRGYSYSRLGGTNYVSDFSDEGHGSDSLTSPPANSTRSNFNGLPDISLDPPETIFNGNFRLANYGSGAGFTDELFDDLWYDAPFNDGNYARILDFYDSTLSTHLTFIPTNTASLSFKVYVSGQGIFGSDDTLNVYFANGSSVQLGAAIPVSPNGGFVTFTRNVTAYRGQSGYFTLDLNGNGILDSTVWLDDLDLIACSFSLSPTNRNHGTLSEVGSITLTSQGGCGWNASTPQSWIHTSSSGSGSGTVNYTVDTNTSFASRVGVIIAGGQTFTVTQAGDTARPSSVSITSPANGASYTNAQTVTISATAADNVGVAKIEFYDGTLLKGTDSSTPYSYPWLFGSADNGAHSWTARAYDAAGNVSTSSVVTLTVSIDITSPTVAITSPANGANLTTSTTTVSGSASDPGSPASGLNLVQVRVNGGSWSNATGTTSWSRSVTLTPCGNTIEARSLDKAGNYSSIASISVTYTPPNTVPNTPSNISPAGGTTGLSLTPTLLASAFSDADCIGDTHAASQWQVLNSAGAVVVADSGTNTANKVSWTVPAAKLNYGSNYVWRVRYQDSRNGWSSYSAQTAFTTGGPQLNGIRLGTNMLLSWPTNDSAFKLFYATNFPAATWISNIIVPAIVNGQYTVTNSPTNRFRFYRLKKYSN